MLNIARHQWDIPVCWFDASYMKVRELKKHELTIGRCRSITIHFQKLFAVTIIIPVGSIFPKSAILVLYLQVFYSNEWIRPAVYFGLLFNICTYVPLMISAIYYTSPRGETTWAELALSTEPQRGLYMSTVKAAMSVMMKLYILALPLPILAKLHLAVAKRLQLIAVFATASV